jgi:hypothetical protein
VSLRKPDRTARKARQVIVAFVALLLLSAICVNPLRAKAVTASYLYNLSNFTGPIRISAPRISVDNERNEVSVLYQNLVRVFNDNGMEIYRFGDDLDVGGIVDLTNDSRGNILLLSYKWSDVEATNVGMVTRCNYRGEPIGELALKNMPPQFAGFGPQRVIQRNGHLYFVGLMDLRVVVTDEEGNFQKGYDIFKLLDLPEKDRGNVELMDLTVHSDGSMLFAIPVLFRAYRLYPDGNISSFGKPGSAPGRFNIVSSMVVDSAGNYLIVDRLKYTVMIFDDKYEYRTQFGFKGRKPGNLIAPDQIAIDKNDRVYITQNGKRGVNVYRVTHD